LEKREDGLLNFLDQLPLGVIFVLATIGQLAFIEIGFRYGVSQQGKGRKAQLAQVRAIMGASLGLLAFMLAFTFSSAQQHFEERTRAYMLEVSAIDSAYRGADLLSDDHRVQAQDLLRHFADLRVRLSRVVRADEFDTVVALVRESEHVHDLLWAIAESSMDEFDGGKDSSIFAQSVLAMVNAHDARLQAALFNRISPVIWFALFAMALLAMLVTGYQAGLTGTRSQLATWTLAITFAGVMTMITDLDRPNMTLFSVDQQLMIELENRMGGGDVRQGGE
jgi:hypothetical protein